MSIIWVVYVVLTLALGAVGYLVSHENKIEYGLAGVVGGLLLSLLVWTIFVRGKK